MKKPYVVALVVILMAVIIVAVYGAEALSNGNGNDDGADDSGIPEIPGADDGEEELPPADDDTTPGEEEIPEVPETPGEEDEPETDAGSDLIYSTNLDGTVRTEVKVGDYILENYTSEYKGQTMGGELKAEVTAIDGDELTVVTSLAGRTMTDTMTVEEFLAMLVWDSAVQTDVTSSEQTTYNGISCTQYNKGEGSYAIVQNSNGLMIYSVFTMVQGDDAMTETAVLLGSTLLS